MKTKIVNVKKEKFDVYVGRPSVFGNPYTLGIDGNRETVIKYYKEYFYEKIKSNAIFKAKVEELKGKILGCFCKPLACHGDIIVKYLEN